MQHFSGPGVRVWGGVAWLASAARPAGRQEERHRQCSLLHCPYGPYACLHVITRSLASSLSATAGARSLSTAQKLGAGMVAGATACAATYPLEALRWVGDQQQDSAWACGAQMG